MGSQQGDDMQLNGDLACQNAEVRGRLTIAGLPVQAGMQLRNAGVPLAGGPFTTFNLVGITGANSGGGVASLTASTPAVVQWTLAKTWAQVYAELNAIAGPKLCLVEPDPSGIRTMTAGTYDLNQVIFIGTSCVSNQSGEGTTIAVAVGVQFSAQAVTGGNRCSVQSQWLSWDFTALTAPAFATAAGDRVTWTQQGGQLAGSAVSAIFSGTVAMSLLNVQVTTGQVVTTNLDTCVIEASASSSFFGSSWVTTAGNQIAVFTDASCLWSLAQFVAGGWVMTGNVTLNNFALGTANQLYAITVNGAGNVIATLAP